MCFIFSSNRGFILYHLKNFKVNKLKEMEKMILTGYIFHSAINLDIIPSMTFELKMENLICLYG